MKQKFRANVDAIKTLQKIEGEGRHATPEEQSALAKFVGWGAMPGAFNKYDASAGDWTRERDEIAGLLMPDEFSAAAKSTLNAHYTSGPVVRGMWDMARRLGFDGKGRVLEPSMGVGNFFGLMPADLRGAALTGIELDKFTGRIAKQLYPQANVLVHGFEDLKTPHGFFDFAISNVPFGDYRVNDKAYNKHRASIHDYFFLKTLDQVRPGGVIMYITSTGTLDKGDSRIRRTMAEKADLVAAIRLPEGAFAKNAGTAVVTDMIILKRRPDGAAPSGPAWTNIKSVPDPAGGEAIPINEYFADNPQQVLGTVDRKSRLYGGNQPHVSMTDDFDQRWSDALARIPEKVYEPRVGPERLSKTPTIAPQTLKEGAYVKGSDGKLQRREQGELVDATLTPKQEQIVADLMGVRDALREVINAQVEGKPDTVTDTARSKLNRAYDGFIKKHGHLNKPENRKAFAEDPDAPVVLALEEWNPKTKTAKKAEAFRRNTVRGYEKPTKASGASEALGISLNETGRVDVERIASLLGRTPEAVGKQLVDDGLAFEDPTAGWQSGEQYLSGNVRQRLLEAREAAKLDKKYEPNVPALEKVQPADVPYDEIDARLGVPWVGPEDIAEFAAEQFGSVRGNFSVKYISRSGEWLTEWGRASLRGTPNDTQILGTSRAGFMDILEAALNNKIITIRDKISSNPDAYKINADETAAANQKVDELQQRFRDWLWQDDARRERLHRHYNDTFNNIAPVRYNGSHLKFPGMSPAIQLREHQGNAVWRIVSTGTALLGHEVGTGKTYTMVAAAMELRRLGLSRKPAISVLKSTLPGFMREAKELYPGAKILAVDKFDAKDRKRIISQIATGDWDLVILTHDHVDMLPMKTETQQAFIQREIDELESVINSVEDDDGGGGRRRGKSKEGNRLVKKLEKAKARLEARLKEALDSKQDDAITFEETGIDQLFVDEAHKYKSLPVYTKQDRVKGIPSGRSDRATNMAMRARWLQDLQNGRGVVFATGTPITNTMAELYTMMKYLQSRDLAERGIEAFDAWARNFGIITTKMEYSVTGEYQPVSRFSKFVNLPELGRIAGQVIDVQRAKDMPTIVRPKRKDEIVTVPMSGAQKAYLGEIRARAVEAKKKKPGEKGDNMLSISGDARKSALDMRLVNRGADAGDSAKVAKVVENVVRVWKEDPTRTQMIFSDIGIHPTKWGYSPFNEIAQRLVEAGIPAEKIINFSTLTDVQKRSASKRLKDGEALIGLGSTDKMGTGVNAQDHLYALHHMDVPWLPGYVEQRDGRGWRQGNLHKQIRILRYTTEGSFDTFMWQAVDAKTRFINQFIDSMSAGKPAEQRSVQDEDTEELTPAQIMAVTSGNPLLLDKINLDRDVAELEGAARRHERNTLRLKDTAKNLDSRVREVQEDVVAKTADLDAIRAAPDTAGELFSIDIGGTIYSDREAAQTALSTVRIGRSDHEQIGMFRGLPLYARQPFGNEAELRLGESVRANFGIASLEYAARANNVAADVASLKARVAQHEKDAKASRDEATKPFLKAAELKQKKDELAAVLTKMTAQSKPADKPSPPPAEDDAGDDDALGAPDDALGAKVTPPGTPRIAVAPLPGGTPKRLDQIVLDFEKSLGKEFRVGRTPRGLIGAYFPGSAKTVIRYAGDLDKTAHEAAHSLDDLFGLVGSWAGANVRSPFDAELIPNFSGYGSVRKSGPLSKLAYQRAEGVAEWIRALAVNPTAARAAAPTFAAHYDATVPAEVRAAVDAFGQDVRRWAGQDAGARQLSNVRVKPDEKGVTQKLREAFKGEGVSFQTTWWDKLVVAAQDSLKPVMKGIAAAKARRDDLGPMLPSEDPEILIRLLPGFNDKYTEMLDTGLVDGAGGKSTPGGVNWLLEPMDSSSRESLERDMRDTIVLLTSERVLEKAKQVDDHAEEVIAGLLKANGLAPGTTPTDPKLRQRIARIRNAAQQRMGHLSGMGGGIFLDHLQAGEALKGLYADPARYDRLEEAAKRYREWADAGLQYMVARGRMSQETYDRIKASNQFYAAFHRVLEHIDPRRAVGKALGSKAEPVQKFTGSTRLIDNPYVNLLDQTFRVYKEADRNAALDAFNNLLRSDRKMHDGPVQDLDAIGRRMMSGDKNTIPVYHEGQLEHWQYDPGVHASLKNWGQVVSPNVLAKVLQALPRFSREMITHSPGFVIRNPIRDAQERFVVSDTGSKPWGSLGRFSDQERADFRLAGGGQFGHYFTDKVSYHRELARRTAELAKDRATILAFPGKAVRAWSDLAKESETRGRLAEYRSAYAAGKREGYDNYDATLYAAFKARGILDFAVAGTFVGELNKYVPFTNARVQGLVRSIKGVQHHPGAFAIRWGLGIGMAAMLPYMLAVAGDDEEEYRQLPIWRRDLYYNFKIGHLWLSIPKPYELGALATTLERGIDAARGNKNALDGHLPSLLKNMLPVDETAIGGPLRTLVELAANRSLFFDRNIVPPYEEGKALALRDTSGASRLGQAMQWVTENAGMGVVDSGVDARKIDHLVHSLGGGSGRLLLDFSDVGRDDRRPYQAAVSASGLLSRPPGYAAVDVQFVMDAAQRIGDDRSKRMKHLNDLLRMERKAKTLKERDEAATRARSYAKSLRGFYEKNADKLLDSRASAR